MIGRISTLVFKAIVPLLTVSLMVLLCYPVCNKPSGFDLFLFWILVGLPFGIRHMWLMLIPKNYGIAGSLGMMALGCIVGGLIGGIIAVVTVIKAVIIILQAITRRI